MKLIFIFNSILTMIAAPIPNNLCQSWLTVLQESGYRLTGPRRALVDIIAGSSRALSPFELYELGRKEYPGLGLVTVYRLLDKLDELGLVQRVHQPRGCHMYLRAMQGHEHLVLCTACGRAEFFSGDDLNLLIDSIAQRSGFQIQEHWLQLLGLCKTCQQHDPQRGETH
jgi:Fur family transcriptional regulator, ferric uptake regulator